MIITTENNNKELIHRLNRAIGQIEAIKRDLSENPKNQDCGPN